MAWAKLGSGKSLPAKKKRMNIDILEELLQVDLCQKLLFLHQLTKKYLVSDIIVLSFAVGTDF